MGAAVLGSPTIEFATGMRGSCAESVSERVISRADSGMGRFVGRVDARFNVAGREPVGASSLCSCASPLTAATSAALSTPSEMRATGAVTIGSTFCGFVTGTKRVAKRAAVSVAGASPCSPFSGCSEEPTLADVCPATFAPGATSISSSNNVDSISAKSALPSTGTWPLSQACSGTEGLATGMVSAVCTQRRIAFGSPLERTGAGSCRECGAKRINDLQKEGTERRSRRARARQDLPLAARQNHPLRLRQSWRRCAASSSRCSRRIASCW